MQATHDATDGFNAIVVADHGHAGLHGVFFVVQRDQHFAALCRVNAQVASDLVRVKHVQRAVAVIGEEVGDIDQSRDRAKADGAQVVLQPCRRRAVFHAFDHAAVEHGAARQRVIVDADADRAREGASHGAHGCGL